jgi:hypothetical protein
MCIGQIFIHSLCLSELEHLSQYSDGLQDGWPGFTSQQGNVPSKLCVRGWAMAAALLCVSLSLSCTFISLVHSQFELIKIKLKKVNYNFFVIFGSLYIHLMPVMDLSWNFAAPPLPQRPSQPNYHSEDTMTCTLASPASRVCCSRGKIFLFTAFRLALKLTQPPSQ